jgi:hypothetical protein
MPKSIHSVHVIERSIISIRGHRVLLDSSLALLYGVTTGNLNKAVARNIRRFPDDFMFRLTADEATLLFQIGRAKGRGGRHNLPYAFTEQGVAMLSSVLRSERAVEVNIEIMRAFVRLRHILSTHTDLARKLDALEAKLVRGHDENAKLHAEHEKHFRIVFETIRKLMTEGEDTDSPARIGFRVS